MKRCGAVMAIVALLFIGACGGGSSGPSKAAFVQRANQLCTKLSEDYAAAQKALPPSPSPDDMKTFVQGNYTPLAIQTYQQIGALGYPKDDAEKLSALLTESIAELKLVALDPTSAGNRQAQRGLVKRFADYGLTECGVGFQKELTREQFALEANAECQRLFDQVVAAAKPLGIRRGGTNEKLAEYVTSKVVPADLASLEALRAIGIPKGDEALLDGLLTDSAAKIADLAKDPSRLFVIDARDTSIADRWLQYGVPVCSQTYTG
jgi:hypothetical protein